MPRLWLPIKKLTVREGNRERIVFIPATGDKVYDKDLEQMAQEKTAEELRKLPPKAISTMSKWDIARALKELRDFTLRQKQGTKKYF